VTAVEEILVGLLLARELPVAVGGKLTFMV
jgi:hypothetical protein